MIIDEPGERTIEDRLVEAVWREIRLCPTLAVWSGGSDPVYAPEGDPSYKAPRVFMGPYGTDEANIRPRQINVVAAPSSFLFGIGAADNEYGVVVSLFDDPKVVEVRPGDRTPLSELAHLEQHIANGSQEDSDEFEETGGNGKGWLFDPDADPYGATNTDEVERYVNSDVSEFMHEPPRMVFKKVTGNDGKETTARVAVQYSAVIVFVTRVNNITRSRE